MVAAVGDADAVHRGIDALALFLRRHVAIGEAKRDVLADRQLVDQVEALEHEAEAVAAQLRELRLGLLRHVVVLEHVAAARRPVDRAEDVEQGRFAAAGRAHDGDEFARIDREIDVGQRRGFYFVGTEQAADAVEMDHGWPPLNG